MSQLVEPQTHDSDTLPVEERAVARLEELERDVNSLTEQVAQDFEELILLQSLTKMLTLQATPADPREFVLLAMEMLPVPLQAECTTFIPDSQGFAELGIVDVPASIWRDIPLLDAECCHALRDVFLSRGTGQPWIQNRGFEGRGQKLDQLVMVEVCHERRRFGWLVGCNHRPDPCRQHAWSQKGFCTIEGGLLQTAASIMASQLHNLSLLRQKERMFTDVVRAMVSALEARDPYTGGHSERVALFGERLGREIGLVQVECERIYLTGLLHDVGKIGIPDAVLQKPGKLEHSERELMETHTDAGWRILHPLTQLKDVLPGVLYHHERFDGKGYPDGLIGKAIPQDGRILAICDAYDAMTSDRPYRKGMSQARAEEILREGAGTHWDPDYVRAFLQAMPDVICIRESYLPRNPERRG